MQAHVKTGYEQKKLPDSPWVIMRRPIRKERMRMRPLLLVAIVLLIIVAVSLHVVGAMFLFKGGFDARSLDNPLSYVLIGLFVVFAIFKLTYLLGHMHTHKPQAAGEMSKGIGSTSDVQHERHRE